MHLRVGIRVRPVAASDRDRTQVFRQCSEVEHVAPRHQRKDLTGRDQAVGHEELIERVLAPDPRRRVRRRRLTVPATRPPVERSEHEHVGGLPAQDRRHREADHAARCHAAGAGLGEEVEPGKSEHFHKVARAHEVHVRTNDAVDVGGV